MPLKVQTVQSVVVRNLVDSLSSILCDVNLKFMPAVGLVITDLDFARVAMVHCKLDAQSFETFEVDREYCVGLYMQHLNNILRVCGANDTLSFAIDDASPTELVIEMCNTETNSRSVYRMFMMDVDEDNLTLPEGNFASVTYMPSQELQRIFRDMAQLSDIVTIRSTPDKLIFDARGDYCNACRQFAKQDVKEGEAEAQGDFTLKYLKLFAKASAVSNFCEIYLKDRFPIILKYAVASLGHLHFCLAPRAPGELAAD